MTTRIDDYELIGKLGEGGMGAVYKARQVSLDRIVALKVLAPKLASQPDFVTRFLREARATAKLNHPNIVAGIGVGSASGYHFFAMEFVEGESFKRQVESKTRISEAEVLRIGAAIGSALAHAHGMGIVHRDVKPDNILIARDGTPKLADLGLAKATSAEDSSLTQTGMAIGTPHYIAPEQANGDPDIDGRADTYALGCTLYHAATGTTPFQANTSAAIMVKHINDRMPHPQSLRPDLTNEFCIILSRMVAREPDDRYATLDDAVADMESILAGEQPSCRPLPAAKNRFVLESSRAQGVPPRRERGETRRHAPIEAGAGASGTGDSRESRRRIASQKSGNPWLMPAVAAGAVVLIGALAYSFSASSKSAPEKTIGGITNPVPATPPPLPSTPPSTPLPGPVPTPLVLPRPVPSVAVKEEKPLPSLPEVERKPVAPETPAVARTEAPPAVKLPQAEAAPTKADTIALFDGTLNGWKPMQPVWTVEDGALVGRGNAGNVSIWKFGGLPLEFDLTFDADDSNGFHFGYLISKTTTLYINFDDNTLRITRYAEDSVELAHAAAPPSHGKHAWRVVNRRGTVELFVDGTLAATARAEMTLPSGKSDVCFFAAQNSTLRIKNIGFRDPSATPLSDPRSAPAGSTPAKPAPEKVAELSAETKAQADAQAAYASFADDYLVLLRKLDAKGAADLADRAAKLAVLAPLADTVKQDRLLLGLLDRLLLAEPEGARKLVDVDDFELTMGHGAPQKVGRKTQLHVVKFEKGAIVLDGGGVTLQTQLTQLSTETRIKLIQMGLPPAREATGAAVHAFLKLLLLKSSTDAVGLAAVREHVGIARTAATSSPAQLEADAIERWAQLVEDGAQNAAAAATWPKLKTMAEQQQWTALKPALADFTHAYDKTRFFQSRRGDIDAWKLALQEAADAALPIDEQVKRVAEKLKAANPNFDGQLTPTVQNGKLTGLQLSAKGIKDLTPFRSVPGLQTLVLTPGREAPVLADLSPLKGLHLTHLEASYSLVSDLSPLAGMPLNYLDIAATGVADLTPLKGMPLETLCVQSTKVSDFSPLHGAPLHALQCFGCNITDLKSLQGLPIETLNCSYNSITDVSPLQTLPVKYLVINEIKTDDLSPLKNLKLITLTLKFKPGVHDALIRDLTTLDYINGMPAADFRARAANGTLP